MQNNSEHSNSYRPLYWHPLDASEDNRACTETPDVVTNDTTQLVPVFYAMFC